MPAYLFANVEVTDAAGYEQYRQRVSATIEAFGGRYLVRGGATDGTGGRLDAKATGDSRVPRHGSTEGLVSVTRLPAAD